MMQRTLVARAAEFKQKSRWSAVWPNMHYGAMFLNYSVGRQLPMKGVNWVTRDSNRLTRFENRYAAVLADLDVKRNEEELSVPLTDVRWNDHRRLYWRCSVCGSAYRKNVSVRTKYHAGCNQCKGRYPSKVLGEQQPSRQSLKEFSPELAQQLAHGDKNDNIASFGAASQFVAEWTCRKCQQPYRASIRSRTGVVEAGQSPLHPQAPAWSAYCPACTWAANMAAVAEGTVQSGHFLGIQAGEKASAAPVPRRRRKIVA